MVESARTAMISPSELQKLLADQPLGRLQALAAGLGWKGLQLLSHVVPDVELARLNLKTQAILWYETSDEKFNLQINIHPQGQTRHYQAIVKAERYGISVTDWHPFVLPDRLDAIEALTDQLKPFLLRSTFKNPAWCKRFLQRHPERATRIRQSKERRKKKS